MRYRLRTLLILLAVLPPVVAWYGWPTLQTWLAKKPLPPPVSAAPPTSNASNGAPYLAVYSTGKLDPVMTENTLRTLLGASNTRIQLDSNTGRVTVWGPNYVHNFAEKIIAQLQKERIEIAIPPRPPPPTDEELERIKSRAADLGAPQPKPLPAGYGEKPNDP